MHSSTHAHPFASLSAGVEGIVDDVRHRAFEIRDKIRSALGSAGPDISSRIVFNVLLGRC